MEISDCKRDGEGELRAAADFAFDPEAAAVGFDDVLGNGETEPCAACFPGPRCIHAVKALEYSLLIGKRNADAGISDRDESFASAGGSGDGDASACHGVLDGVVEEILKDLAKQASIAANQGKPGGNIDRQGNLFAAGFQH